MNKYQEALDNYSENVDYRDYSTKTVDIVNESYDTLQELVNKTKTPTLEQVKKEWEESGYEWKEDEDCIYIDNFKTYIRLYKNNKLYESRSLFGNVKQLTIQEHQLLTKTFRALGWFDE